MLRKSSGIFMDTLVVDKLKELATNLCRENDAELLYLTLFGSTLYGTELPGKSDIDVRGIFLPSADKAVLGELPHSLHWSSGDNESRNRVGDIDIDLWSLQHWILTLLPSGDIGAVDLLFSPSNHACTLVNDPRLATVFASPHRLIEIRHCRAYADYSLGQAKKYGIKGSRLGALRSVYKWLASDCPSSSLSTRLKDVLDKLVTACGDGKYCEAIIHNGEPALQLCGKIYVGGIRLSEFTQRVTTAMNSYGTRAIAAEQNQGLDFKALSHALRAFDQMEELYSTGKIVFPLRTREKLKVVKRGDIPWEELEKIIIRRLNETDTAREHAIFTAAYDIKFAKAQVLACYGKASINLPQ